MKTLSVLLLFFSFRLEALNPLSLISHTKALKKGTEVAASLAPECLVRPELFVQELYQILRGIGHVVGEMATQKVMSEGFPNICHVLTKPQIASYTENTHDSGWSCRAHMKVLGKKVCLAKVKATRPKPHYWWPKYFLEVTKKGLDPYKAFASENKLYSLNRKLAKKLKNYVDSQGAITLTSYVMGSKNLLSALGMEVGEQNWEDLFKLGFLAPFESMRLRANNQKTLATFEVNIWPVLLSKTLAEHFTVCGPKLKKQGKHPGGYSWPFKGVAQTCPVALSSDAYAYWDTGMIDYLDPQAIASMAVSSHPLTCGAAEGMRSLSKLGAKTKSFLGDKKGVEGLLKGVGGKLSQSLRSCSWPIMGSAQAIASKLISLGDPQKWETNCTFWGPLAPRMSSHVFDNDYTYANSALRFKLLAHELFGLPRGREERWSLAYPWEEKIGDSGLVGKLTTVFTEKLNQMGVKWSFSNGFSRSEGLYPPGHPIMVNASASTSYLQDRAVQLGQEVSYLKSVQSLGNAALVASEIRRLKKADEEGENSLPGDRRIYTLWEKIECKADAVKITTKPLNALKISEYKSCKEAIRFEVYKFIQTELLRDLCDLLKQKQGRPFK